MLGNDKKTIWKKSCPINSEFNSTPVFDPELTPFVENLNTIEEFFNFFIDDQIVTNIVQCTNKRIAEDTKDVTETEIRGFIGLLLLFGVTKKHDVEISEIFNPNSANHLDWATVCMSRDRFKFISSKITFDDVGTRTTRFTSNPKLHKINQIFDYFNGNLQKGLIVKTKYCTFYFFISLINFIKLRINPRGKYLY